MSVQDFVPGAEGKVPLAWGPQKEASTPSHMDVSAQEVLAHLRQQSMDVGQPFRAQVEDSGTKKALPHQSVIEHLRCQAQHRLCGACRHGRKNSFPPGPREMVAFMPPSLSAADKEPEFGPQWSRSGGGGFLGPRTALGDNSRMRGFGNDT